MKALYTFGIRAYGMLLRAASLTNPKAKLWINGRKILLKTFLLEIHPKSVFGFTLHH